MRDRGAAPPLHHLWKILSSNIPLKTQLTPIIADKVAQFKLSHFLSQSATFLVVLLLSVENMITMSSLGYL